MTDLISAWQGKRVLVMGDAMRDIYIYGKITRRSPEADCPVFEPQGKVEYPGGAANVRANIMSLGGIAQLICPPVRSVKTRYVDEAQGHLIRIDEDQSAADVTPDVVEVLLNRFMAAIRHCEIVVLSDYAKGALRDEVLRPAIRIAKDAQKIIIVDPKRKDWTAYAGADVFTPNMDEWDAMDRPLDDIAPGASVVITQGDHGMSLVGGPNNEIRAIGVTVSDVSGAGDTVVAALALGLAAGGPLYDAAVLANAAAAIAVSKPGTSTVTADELRASL